MILFVQMENDVYMYSASSESSAGSDEEQPMRMAEPQAVKIKAEVSAEVKAEKVSSFVAQYYS